MFTLNFDLLGFERKVPALDSIETTTISFRWADVTFSDAENISTVIDLHKVILSDKAINKSRPENRVYSYIPVDITYQLAGGKSLVRSYSVLLTEENLEDETASASMLQDFWDSDPVLRQRMAQLVPGDGYVALDARITLTDGDDFKDVTLTAEQADDFYKTCVLPDIQDGTLGQYSLLNGLSAKDGVISITFYSPGDMQDPVYKGIDLTPTEDSYRTNAYLKSLGFDIFND
jgi:hypothetical protein